MLFRKVLYAYDHPGVWTLGGRLPQQCPHRPALWRASGMPGWTLQTYASAPPPARARKPDLPEQSLLVPLLDRPVLHTRRTSVRRHAPSLDGDFPGDYVPELPPRGGGFYVESLDALSLSHVQ